MALPPRCRSRSMRRFGSAVPPAVWKITHASPQPPVEHFELTHERTLPLPLAVNLHTATGVFACTYAGHGHCKTTFRIERHSKVLKLTPAFDQEPDVSQRLAERCRTVDPNAKICPDIYEVQANVREYDVGGKLRGQWFAWTAEYTIPLHKYLRMPPAALNNLQRANPEDCIKAALLTQIRAAQQGLMLSDNNLNNFGVACGRVVILDLGSRTLVEPGKITKSQMNKTAILGWWKKLATQCERPEDFQRVKRIWQDHMSFEEVAAGLSHASLPNHEASLPNHGTASSVVQPARAITEAPHVSSLFEQDEEAINWFAEQFLFGTLCNFRLHTDGRAQALENEEHQAVDLRLEAFLRVTQRKRQPYVTATANTMHVLRDEEFQELYRNWQDDYSSWMNQRAQDKWFELRSGNARQQFERTRFRTFLHQMVGSFDFVRLCLYAPLTSQTFAFFRKFYGSKSNPGFNKAQDFARMLNDVRNYYGLPLRSGGTSVRVPGLQRQTAFSSAVQPASHGLQSDLEARRSPGYRGVYAETSTGAASA